MEGSFLKLKGFMNASSFSTQHQAVLQNELAKYIQVAANAVSITTVKALSNGALRRRMLNANEVMITYTIRGLVSTSLGDVGER